MPNFWVERLEQHAVHAAIKSLRDALSEARQHDGDEGIDAALSRLELVTEHVQRAIGSIDPFLISTVTLDQLAGPITAITTEVRGYATDQQPNHLTSANTSADTLVPLLHPLLVPAVPQDARDLGTSIAALRKAVAQQLEQLRAETARHVATLAELQAKSDAAKTEIQSQLEAHKADVTAQKTRLETAITLFQTQSATAETARQTAFSASENQRQETATAAEQKRAEQATTTEEQRRSQFSAAADDRKTAFETMKSEWTETSGNWRTSFSEEQKSRKDSLDEFLSAANAAKSAWEDDAKKRGDAGIAALEAKKEEAQKLVHVIGNTGMTGGYKRVADAELQSRKNWERIALAAMVGLIAFALYAFIHAVDSDFKWGVFAARVFVAVTFGILASYAAQQSHKHRDVEQRSRKLELELASIDPYLASLPEEKRIEVKKLMADRFFGQALPEAKETPPMSGVLDVAKASIETAGKALDAIKPK